MNRVGRAREWLFLFCRVVSAVGLVGVLASPLAAEDVPDWVKSLKIKGYMFGDYYGVASHHDAGTEGSNGFWFRRIYLTFDKKASDDFDARLRFESASPGDFTSKSKMEPSVKDAYVRWKRGKRSVYMGLSGTPTWGVVEKYWGYRAVEKTPLDLQKLGSSRDFGLALKGSSGGDTKLAYHVMVGHGNSNKAETDEGKKVMGSLSVFPGSVVVEVYGDFEVRPGGKDRSTIQGFAAVKNGWGRAGVHVAQQSRKDGDGGTLDLSVGSAFLVLDAGDQASVLVRVDRMFEPNPGGGGISYIPFDPTAKSTLILAGVDLKVHKGLSIIPNVEAVVYDAPDGGEAPSSTVIGRVTVSARL